MQLFEILKIERERRNISQVQLCESLMKRGIDVSNATISRVEKGSVPSWPVVKGYCDIFGWSLAELERRLNEESPDESDDDDITEVFQSRRKIASAVGRHVPVLSWINAGSWGDSPYIEDHDQDKAFVPGKLPKNTFALRVTGTSMEDCNGKYHFPNGSLILVNPDLEAKENDFVVAVNENTQEATFKQLVYDCGNILLKPLNSQYPIMKLKDSTSIKGVVFRVIDDRKI